MWQFLCFFQDAWKVVSFSNQTENPKRNFLVFSYIWLIYRSMGGGGVKDFTPYQNYLPKGEREREREREREYFGESWRWITMQTKCLCSHNKLRKIYSALSRREVNLDEHKSRGYEEPIKICASLLSLHVLKVCSILCHIRLAINLLTKVHTCTTLGCEGLIKNFLKK